MSHWRWKRRKRPPIEYILPDLEKEAASVNAGMDEIDAALDNVGTAKRHVVLGNHDQWVNHFIEEHPYLKDYEPHKLLKFRERGWTWTPHGDYYKVGDLNFTHGGHYTGVNHTRGTALGTGANVMYGHFHDQQVTKVQRLGGLYGAWSIGCLCKLKKPFLGGKPSNWNHGFAIVHFEKNGNFLVEQVEIFEGKCWVYGQRVEAK